MNSSQSPKPSLTIIVLTFNEERHIQRCLDSAQRVASHMLVVDSGSTDNTVLLARQAGARVLSNPWVNHATQVNWAIEHGDIQTEWVMRLDADEFLDDALAESIVTSIPQAESGTCGFELNRRIRFLGTDIRHGGMAPLWVLRLWRKGMAVCENRWMDEHMVLSSGKVARLSGVLIDENLNDLTWWTQKHNGYSSREAIEVLIQHYGIGQPAVTQTTALNRQARIKRWLKVRVYSRLPLGFRPWLYFIYRVLFRFAFLDGMRGMLFHTLQGLWYRLLVDAKVREVQDAIAKRRCDPAIAIRDILGIDIRSADAQRPGTPED